jgi:hypothetical protein
MKLDFEGPFGLRIRKKNLDKGRLLHQAQRITPQELVCGGEGLGLTVRLGLDMRSLL